MSNRFAFTNKELIEALYTKVNEGKPVGANVSRATVANVLSHSFEVIKEKTMEDGKSVTINGFGRFFCRIKKGRTANLEGITGKKGDVYIPAKSVLCFKRSTTPGNGTSINAESVEGEVA